MPILGVVVHHPHPSELIDFVSTLPGVSLCGEPGERRLPVVLETAQKNDDEPLFAALGALPGVVGVDLVFADFSDLLPSEVSS